jgi:hypothetical protein
MRIFIAIRKPTSKPLYAFAYSGFRNTRIHILRLDPERPHPVRIDGVAGWRGQKGENYSWITD